MLKKFFFKILYIFVISNNSYAPHGNVVTEDRDIYFNELPNYNNEVNQDQILYNSRECFAPYEEGTILPLGFNSPNQNFNNNNGQVYTPSDTALNVIRYSFESHEALNENNLSEIITLLKNLNTAIFQNLNDVSLINQCFQKISKLDKCHIQISCGLLLLYLNNLKTVKNEAISFFVVDYYNHFIKTSDEVMSSFYEQFKRFIDSRAFDFSRCLIENHFFINDYFKNDLESFLFNYRMLFSENNSSSIFNFSSKGFCLRCSQSLSKNNSNCCRCSINEQNGGFNYKPNEKILFEYITNNEKFVPIFLQDRTYKFLGYGFDIFGDVFVAVEQEGLYYFVPIGLVFSGPKIIVYDNKLFFVNNESDFFSYRSVNNLRNTVNTSEKLYDYELLVNKLNIFFNNNLVLILMICIPIFAIMFFVLFCVNWSGHCHNCGNPAVKFLGGLFNFSVGGEFGLLFGEFIFNFKNLMTADSVIRYAVSINNGFCNVRKIIRSKMSGNLMFNNLFVILGATVSGLLMIWPFIWFIVIEALSKRLVNGVSFIAGLSLLISGFCVGSLVFYWTRYKKIKNILEYDCLN